MRIRMQAKTSVGLPTAFSRICLLWMLYSQALLTIGLWHVESDVSELFGSPPLDGVFRQLFGLGGLGTIGLAAVGVPLTLLYLVKQRGFGTDSVWTLLGLGYLTLIVDAAALMWWSLPELYAPPPGLPQLLRVGVVIALDVMYVAVIRSILVRYTEEMQTPIPTEPNGAEEL